MLVMAVLREVDIIGEAAAKLSEETRKAHAEVPWAKIIGMLCWLLRSSRGSPREIRARAPQRCLPGARPQACFGARGGAQVIRFPVDRSLRRVVDGPPVEEGVRADRVFVYREGVAALGDQALKVFEGFDAPVRHGFVHEGPEVLGGLELRRVRWEEHEVDALWNDKALRGVPAGSVQHEHDALAGDRRQPPRRSASGPARRSRCRRRAG